MLTLTTFVLLACTPPDMGDDDAGGDDGDGDDTTTPSIVGPDDVTMDDSDDGLTVTIQGGSATGWLFGFARPSEGWEDETCRDANDLCHTLGPDGGFIEFKGEFCDDPEDGATCIPRLYFRASDTMTYILKPDFGLGCWVWGHDPSYYDSLGCTQTAWEDDSYDG